MTEQTSHDSSIRERNYLPLDTRMQLYGRVRELSGLGLSYRQIQDAILTSHQVRLAKSTISVWVNGLHDPTGRLNTFRANPTPELAYVMGVILSDGNLNVHGYNAELMLAVTDYEFAKEFSRCLAIVLQREHPHKVRWHARKNRWVVQGSSVLLYNFLRRDWRNFKKWIEHCDRCRGAFLRAFYDSEGSISRELVVSNTRRDLLTYVQKLLKDANIETTSPRVNTRAGTSLKDPRTGRIYLRRKDCLQFSVRIQSISKFAEYVGFTIERKSKRLREATLRASQWSSVDSLRSSAL